MLVVLLAQLAPAGLPGPVIVALMLVVAANVLALLVCVRLARRMRAIGDAGAKDDDQGMGDGRARERSSRI